MTAAVHQLQYGETTIEYHLTFVDRKTLGISVLPDLTVEVKAPLDSELDSVEARVRQRANWILRQQPELERYLPHVPPRQIRQRRDPSLPGPTISSQSGGSRTRVGETEPGLSASRHCRQNQQ